MKSETKLIQALLLAAITISGVITNESSANAQCCGPKTQQSNARNGNGKGNGGGGGESRYHQVSEVLGQWLHRYLEDGTLVQKLPFDKFNEAPTVKRWLSENGHLELTPDLLVQIFDEGKQKVGGRVRFIKESELAASAVEDFLAKELLERKSRTCLNWVNPDSNQGYVYCVTERWNAETARDQGVLGLHEPLGVMGIEEDVIDAKSPSGMDSHYSTYPISPEIWKFAGEKIVEVREFQMFQNSVSEAQSTTFGDIAVQLRLTSSKRGFGKTELADLTSAFAKVGIRIVSENQRAKFGIEVRRFKALDSRCPSPAKSDSMFSVPDPKPCELYEVLGVYRHTTSNAQREIFLSPTGAGVAVPVANGPDEFVQFVIQEWIPSR